MPVYDVPPEHWPTFCHGFSRDHAGQAVTVDRCDDPALETTTTLRNTTLKQLEAVSDPDATPALVLNLVDTAGQAQRYTLPAVTRMRLEQPEPVSEAGGILRVESDRGESLTLRFGAPLMPGMLNGIT